MDKNTIDDKVGIGSPYGASAKRTEIIFRDPVTGEDLFVFHNKVVIAGAQFTACKHFDIPKKVALPTYNQSLALEKSVTTAPINIPKLCLFGCGIDGCGTENSQVYPVKYAGRINPNALIPFKYQLTNNDLSVEMRNMYYGRKTASGRIAYYFKAFDTAPELVLRRVDGTLIDPNLYDSEDPTEAETFVEFTLKITKTDFRDYFLATTGIETAKINNVSIMSAWYNESEGYKWYQDIDPVTQLNIPNEPLIDLTKGIDIIYHIYY